MPTFARRPSTVRFKKDQVITCSDFSSEAVLWIKEVELVDSMNELESWWRLPRLWTRSNSKFKKKVNLEEQKAQTEDRFLIGRRIAFMVYDNFRVTCAHDTVWEYADLFSIMIRNSVEDGMKFNYVRDFIRSHQSEELKCRISRYSMRGLLQHWTESSIILTSKEESVWRNERPKSRAVSFAGDRLLTWSTNTFGSLEPMILSKIMPTNLLLLFEMMIFRNSIQSGTEFYCLWLKSRMMTSWKACTSWEYVSLRSSKPYWNCTTWRFIRKYRCPTIKN